MHRWKTGFRMSIMALALLGLVLASAAWAGKKDNTLQVAFTKELESLDRYYNTAREGIVFARHVYDNLLFRDPETFEYKGLLAKSFEWEDELTMNIELRKGVKFHNGQEMTADDAVYTLSYAADPENKVKTQRYSNWIKSVEKTGPYAFTIHLKYPFPPALEFLSGANPIYPKDYYQEVGHKGFGVKPIGSGPYKVTEVEPGKRLVLVKNENYFQDSPKGQPSIGKIVWRTLPEMNTQVAELITGALDWAFLVPPDQAEKLKAVPNVQVVSAETMRIGYLTFDAANFSEKKHDIDNPFKKVEVRQAVSHAINRKAIAKNLIGEGSRPVYTPCYPSQFGCIQEAAKKYPYDPEKSRLLLASAGYPDGFDCILYAYRNRPFAEAMVGNMKAVGIDAKLVMLKYSALRERQRAGKTPMQFLTWGSYSINDVSAIISNFFEHEADDITRDPQVKKWLEAADTELDTAKRKELYGKAITRITEQAYWAPLFTYVSNNCFTKDLNFTPYADAVPRFFMATWK